MDTGTNVDVGQRIRELRRSKGMSQKAVAEPLISRAYLSLIESGQRPPTKAALEHIAHRLEVDPDELVAPYPASLEAELELALQKVRRDLHTGELSRAAVRLTETESTARQRGVARLVAAATTLNALLEEQRDNVEAALELHQKAQRLWDDYGPAHLKFESVAGQARCELRCGNARDAIYILSAYLVELDARRVVDPTAQMRIYSSLVPAYNTVGLTRDAVQAAENAIELSQHVDNPEQLACMNMNVARTLLDQGRHQDALDGIRKAEQLFSSLDWPLGTARALINRGIVEFEKKNLEEARMAYEAALTKLKSVTGSDVNRAAVLNELARIDRISGDVSKAKDTLGAARALFDDDRSIFLAFNRREMGRCLAAEDDREAAVADYYDALEIYRVLDARNEFATTALELARELRSLGRLEESLQVFESGLEFTLESEPMG